MSLLATALDYWLAGLCPMPRLGEHAEPCFLDAKGQLCVIHWGQHKLKQPEWPTVERWFRESAVHTTGMLLLTGCHAHPRAPYAAFLQILDLESAAVFEAFQEDLLFSGHADILHRCVLERTPSGGAHVGFWCAAISDKQKITLARRQTDRKILIELLQHQPCTVSPTAVQCKPEHPPGVPYTLTHGSWTRPHDMSPAQREVLLQTARALNEVPEQVAAYRGSQAGQGDRPGDHLNAQADADWWLALLTRHGWRDVSRPGLQSNGILYLQRPGKFGRQPSATYGKTGQCLYVFSSNAQPFAPDTGYTPFHALALLEHDGNFVQAARALTPATPEKRPGLPGVRTSLRPIQTTLRRI